MPAAEVAAAILPLFSSDAATREVWAMAGIVAWFRTGSYSFRRTGGSPGEQQFEDPDFRAAAEAIQVLEHAGLLMRSQGGQYALYLGLTRLGWHALQTNTVRQHLGLGDATSTS
jgi:hypothetical protein